jgi:conjugative relaxase-like TrwC/TraI family protein
MVTAKTQHSLKNAEEYFEEHLSVGDYYDQGQRVAGEWIGLGAERLGLSGKVRAEDFLRLCENQHPATGEKLTPELKTTWIQNGEKVADRRIFYDFTFSPPKSVSIAGWASKVSRCTAIRVLDAKSGRRCCEIERKNRQVAKAAGFNQVVPAGGSIRDITASHGAGMVV